MDKIEIKIENEKPLKSEYRAYIVLQKKGVKKKKMKYTVTSHEADTIELFRRSLIVAVNEALKTLEK